MESGWKNDVLDLSIENDESGDGATKPELVDDRMYHPITISNTNIEVFTTHSNFASLIFWGCCVVLIIQV